MARDNRYVSTYIFGAICPQRAVGAGLIMPYANSHAMNEHLKEISAHVAAGAHALMLCDGDGIRSLESSMCRQYDADAYPALSPKLNPMENAWQYLRHNQFATLVWQSYEAIVDACVRAWNFLASDPPRIRSIGKRDWACVSQYAGRYKMRDAAGA